MYKLEKMFEKLDNGNFVYKSKIGNVYDIFKANGDEYLLFIMDQRKDRATELVNWLFGEYGDKDTFETIIRFVEKYEQDETVF